ncbi:hypothetical protein BC834DRAFT_103220 [Gloeopeniophorella convolvens]|nr:hypothetical protein BC834DRAFT_103220 [Gloeopeniophorella convolvens]
MNIPNYSRPPLRLSDHGPPLYRFPTSCERSTSGWHVDEPLPTPDPKMIYPPLPPSSDWTDELREICTALSRLGDSGMLGRVLPLQWPPKNAPIILFWNPLAGRTRRQYDTPTGGRHAVSLSSSGELVRQPSYIAELENQNGGRGRYSLYLLAQVEAHVKPWSAGHVEQAYFKVFADFFWKPEDRHQYLHHVGLGPQDGKAMMGLFLRHIQQSLSPYPWYQGAATDAEAFGSVMALAEISQRIGTYMGKFLQQPLSQRGPVPVVVIGELTPRPGITM